MDIHQKLQAALKIVGIETDDQKRYWRAWDGFFSPYTPQIRLQDLPNWQTLETFPFTGAYPSVFFAVDPSSVQTSFFGWVLFSGPAMPGADILTEIDFPAPAGHWILSQLGDLEDDTDFR